MAASDETEEFEFRLRAEKEAATAKPKAKPAEAPEQTAKVYTTAQGIPMPGGEAAPEQPEQQTFGQKALDVVVGPFDAAKTLVSGGIASLVGPVAGVLSGGGEKGAAEVMDRLTNKPQTQTGRSILEKIGGFANA